MRNNLTQKFFLIYSILSLWYYPGCTTISQQHVKTINIAHFTHQQITQKTNIEAPWITLWIHGTFFFTNHALPRFIRCPKGLHHISDFKQNSYHYMLIKNLIATNPNNYSLDEFYVFGWSGKLSFIARKEAAQELYQGLYSLKDRYFKKYHQLPKIRIITHSHGGNVALNMASLSDEKIIIDELILLACPVQEETKEYIQHTMFKKIISIFSRFDMVQIMDPQGIYPKSWHAYAIATKRKTPLFSERLFKPCDKLTQIKVVKNNRGLFHIEFMLPKFLKCLPNILAHV